MIPQGIITLKKTRDTLIKELSEMVYARYPTSIITETTSAIEILENVMTEIAGEEWQALNTNNIWYVKGVIE